MSKLSFFIVFVLISASATAQEQSHLDAARELLEVTNADQAIQQSHDQIYSQLAGMADQMGISEDQRPTFDKYLEKMVAVMKEEMNWEKMESHILKAYVDVYSEEELRELIEFYASPIGQKFVDKMPDLIQATMQLSQEMMQDYFPKMLEIQKELQAELKQQATE